MCDPTQLHKVSADFLVQTTTGWGHCGHCQNGVSVHLSETDVVFNMERKARISMDISGRMMQRVCIWFSCKTGQTAKQTLLDLNVCFGNRRYSKTAVYWWYSQFQSGRTKVGDIWRSGRPRTARVLGVQQKCRVLVHNNRRVGIHELSCQLGVSYGSVFNILHKDLKLNKKSAKLIPHQLTAGQRAARIQFSREFLRAYHRDPRFLNWILTTDEAWFYAYDPLSNIESKEWMMKGKPRPQIVRRERSVAKLMVIPFFDRQGLLYLAFYRNMTVTQRVFLPLLVLVRHAIRVRRGRRVWSNRDKYMLHMDNASAHRGKFVRDAIRDWQWPQLRHPAYSPDLSPCDFFLFPLLKRRLRGRHFGSLDILETAILNEVGSIPQEMWRRCFQDWVIRCRRCIQMRGNYFEGRH